MRLGVYRQRAENLESVRARNAKAPKAMSESLGASRAGEVAAERGGGYRRLSARAPKP
jgi:hypothetical protein